MKNKSLIIISIFLGIAVIISLFISIFTANNPNEIFSDLENENNITGSYEKKDDFSSSSSNTEGINAVSLGLGSDTKFDSITLNSKNNKYTIGDLKAEFKAAGIDDDNKYMFKPFYNVEPDTEFTFHFNNKVDPIKAITVHTDEKCDYLSLVWQINSAYWTENGIDVIVKPSNKTTILYSEGRNDVTKENVWGYAPIYYLCIRYDMDSTEVKKLDNPIIIPFTVKQNISTPTLYANIDEKGTFSVKWNPVKNAVAYKVYEAYSASSTWTEAELGYRKELKLVTTLDASKLEFNPGYLSLEDIPLGGTPYPDNTKREKVENYNFEKVNYQNDNLSQNKSFYVTAVDSNGNESNFGTPINAAKYMETLPWHIKDAWKLGSISEFPNTVEVESVDRKTIVNYPINFYRIKSEKDNKPYSTTRVYRYEVVGTELTGITEYANKDNEFPENHMSNYETKKSYMQKDTIDKIPQVEEKTFADSEYKNAKIDLKTKVDYPEDARVKLNEGNIMIWVDNDLARRCFTPQIGAKDPREEIDSFIYDGNPEYIVKRENGSIIVEKVENWTPTQSNKEEVKKEPETEKPAQEIDNSNYVEEQRKSTEKQVTEADKEEVKGTKYPVFADNAAQMYLALAMINQEEIVSLKAFPEYQNLEELLDDLLYLWYQNPYIMGIDLSKTKYIYETQELLLKYNVPTATAKKYQEAVYQKSKQVVNEIIKPSMTEQEKIVAIWDYLENNTAYNHEALAYAKTGANDLYQKYPNSWNTYGILCEELGVCQSYAYAFNALAYESGLKSVMVTGTINNGGHAWNAVKLANKWYMIDTTNNGKSHGIPYWICDASTDFIYRNGFVFDAGFVDGTDYTEFYKNDNTKDWYYINDKMITTGKELAKIWEKEYKTNEVITAKIENIDQVNIDTLIEDFVEEIEKDGYINECATWEYFIAGGIIVLSK